MFGIATQSDLRTIRVSVDKLTNNEKELANVMNKSISIINVTEIEMAENRQKINRITASLSNVDAKLGNITQALEHEVFQLGQFVQLNLKLDAIIQNVRHTIW